MAQRVSVEPINGGVSGMDSWGGRASPPSCWWTRRPSAASHKCPVWACVYPAVMMLHCNSEPLWSCLRKRNESRGKYPSLFFYFFTSMLMVSLHPTHTVQQICGKCIMLPVFARTFIRSKTTLVTAMQREAFSPGGTKAISPYAANLCPEDSLGDSSSASKQVDLTLYINWAQTQSHLEVLLHFCALVGSAYRGCQRRKLMVQLRDLFYFILFLAPRPEDHQRKYVFYPLSLLPHDCSGACGCLEI